MPGIAAARISTVGTLAGEEAGSGWREGATAPRSRSGGRMPEARPQYPRSWFYTAGSGLHRISSRAISGTKLWSAKVAKIICQNKAGYPRFIFGVGDFPARSTSLRKFRRQQFDQRPKVLDRFAPMRGISVPERLLTWCDSVCRNTA